MKHTLLLILLLVLFLLLTIASCAQYEQPAGAEIPMSDFQRVDEFLKAWQEADVDPNNPAQVIKPKPWRKSRTRVKSSCTEQPARASLFSDADIPVLIRAMEDTGNSPLIVFTGEWLSCHPNDEPFEHIDLNGDGLTNLIDYAMLAKEWK